MNENRRNKKDGKKKNKGNRRDWNLRFGNTAVGRAYNYIHIPMGMRRESRFGRRSIPTGDYITPRSQRSQLQHQSQPSQSEYQTQHQSQSEPKSDAKSDTETPSQQPTPDPQVRSFTTPDSQSQQLVQSPASYDAHNTDIEMPPSREQTPMPMTSVPSTDESNRNVFPSIRELEQRGRQHFNLVTPPDNNNNNDNNNEIPIRLAFGHEFMDVIEAVRTFLPDYFSAILNTQEQCVIFRKYFKSICCDHGCLKLGTEKYCLRAWIKGKLSSKHYWHCSKSRGSRDYTCDCDQWQATDDMKCFHTLISTLADNYRNYKQSKIHVDIQEYQKTNAENVVYLGTYHPS